MGINKAVKAILIIKNIEVEVYKLKNGNWCNYDDCKTQYKTKELRFV